MRTTTYVRLQYATDPEVIRICDDLDRLRAEVEALRNERTRLRDVLIATLDYIYENDPRTSAQGVIDRGRAVLQGGS